jgi:hypothetical protein
MIPLKSKTWILKKRLPFSIDIEPSKIDKDSEFIEDMNSEKLIYKVSHNRFIPLIYFALTIFGGLMFLDREYIHTIDIILATIGFSISIFFLAWFIFYQKNFVIFNRKNGIVSIPGPFWYKNIEIPFHDVVAIIRKETYYYAHLNALNLYRPDGFKADVGINSQSLDDLHHDWAFYVRYMDKNYPLPASLVFDT